MNTKSLVTLAGALAGFYLVQTHARAQGSLMPPAGVPAPVMKSLDQIEARAPISSAPFTITQPGAYYLTTNLTVASGNAIIIASSGVSLDLGGFTIASSFSNAIESGAAILLQGNLTGIKIANGHIKSGVTNQISGGYAGPGFSAGVDFAGASYVQNAHVRDLSVEGCGYSGINLGLNGESLVESCTVRTVGGMGSGIQATTVRNSIAVNCLYRAIHADQVADSKGQSTSHGQGYGILADTAQNCTGLSSNGIGVFAIQAMNCNGSSFHNTGLAAETAINCKGRSVNDTGLYSVTAQNCYGYVEVGDYGMDVAGTASFCRAQNSGGTALRAAIAIGCTSGAGPIIAPQKHLGTP